VSETNGTHYAALQAPNGRHAAARTDEAPRDGRFGVKHQILTLGTDSPTQFLDVTDRVAAAVRDAGLETGTVTVQTRHTTTGILVNEHEPLLLEDLRALFDRLVPSDALYAHDDLSRRTVNLGPVERRNGHAHARAALLRSSEAIAVRGGRLDLGRWQRVFFAEFDGGQRRHLHLTMMGEWPSRRARDGEIDVGAAEHPRHRLTSSTCSGEAC